MAKIGLDPGHYLGTQGKASPDNTLLEYEFNQAVAEIAEKKILATKLAEVVVTKRIGDNYDDKAGLKKRYTLINDKKADICISIHANAHINSWTSARGFEVFSYPGRKDSAKLSQICHKYYQQILAPYGVPDRGMKTENFAMIRGPKCPSILIEFEFFTNHAGCNLLKRSDFRNACADVVIKTAFEYLGIIEGSKPVKPTTKVLKVGDTGDLVNALQDDLIALKYLPIGSDDSKFGPQTQRAVIAFQKDNGLTQDGIVGQSTKDKIAEKIKNLLQKQGPRILQIEDEGQDVKLLQNDLIKLKYLPAGSNDGDFGPKTKAAVIKFQTDNKLKADGIVGPATRTAISKKL